MSRPRLIALLLALGTLIVFLPVAGFNFVNYDDNDYITKNATVQAGLTWKGVQWAFTGYHASNWHPLTWLSHMIDCSLFGVNPGAMHFVNVLFHAANVALLFVLLRLLTQKIWPAALVAALFAWHPLHVESVAWIAERKDVLSTFFWLLALLSYTKFVKENCRRSYWFAFLFFSLGLLAKPMLVTLPFVLLLLDYWPLARFSLSAFRPSFLTEKIPFFLLAAIFCVITFLAQKNGASVISLAEIPLGYRLENAPAAAVGYLQNFFWPANLSVIYPMAGKIPVSRVIVCVAVLILISVAAWQWRNSKPCFITGWLWFLGTLVPVIGIVQVGAQAMADRYTYVPSIGFFIAVVYLGNDFAARIQTPRIIRFGFAGLVALACILAAENQLPFWRNSETLFRHAVAVTKNNDIALVNLGVELDAQGRFAEAAEVYNQAEKINDHSALSHNNFGAALGSLGQHAKSLAQYREALRLEPDNARLHNAAGTELVALNEPKAALSEFFAAEALDTNYAAPHLEAAKVFFEIGRDADGLNEFRNAVRLDSDNYKTLAVVAHYLAANENAAARDGRSALVFALAADELSGHVQPVVQDYLGMAFAETGDFTNAVTCAQNALALANAFQMKDIAPLQNRLQLYQARRPWHESFRITSAPAGN